MITVKDLNPKGFPASTQVTNNLIDLAERLNHLEQLSGYKFQFTSGLRDLADHKRIYMEKAAKQGIKNPRIPMGSQHLVGNAADVADTDNSMKAFFKLNVHMLVEAGLWCEEGTDKWTHFQRLPPKSGARWFLP